MGHLSAVAMAECVANDEVALQAALTWHVRSNHYPPLPVEYVEILLDAINTYNTAEYGEKPVVLLPKDLPIVPGAARYNDEAGVWIVQCTDLFSACNAWDFVTEPHYTDEEV